MPTSKHPIRQACRLAVDAHCDPTALVGLISCNVLDMRCHSWPVVVRQPACHVCCTSCADKPAALHHRAACEVGPVMPHSLQLCGQCCCVVNAAGCTDNAAGVLTCSQHSTSIHMSSVGGKRNLHFQAATPPTAAAFHYCLTPDGLCASCSRVQLIPCAHDFLQHRICSTAAGTAYVWLVAGVLYVSSQQWQTSCQWHSAPCLSWPCGPQPAAGIAHAWLVAGVLYVSSQQWQTLSQWHSAPCLSWPCGPQPAE